MQPYNDKEPKKEQVRRMFDSIAPRYDLLNRTLSLGTDRGWRRKLVRAVRRDGCRSVLDVATGTGDLVFAIARKCPGCTVTGFDLSAGMLEVARKRIAKAGLQGKKGKVAEATRENHPVDFVQGEAEAMPFASGSFDGVTCAFGVRNFHDLGAGLAEMARVLGEGGKVYILEFSTPHGRLFGALYRWYFHKVLPWVGGLISKDREAYRYLPGSVDEFPSAERFMEMMCEAGFDGCTCRRLTNGVACLYTGTLARRAAAV